MRILIADAHSQVRFALRVALERQPGITRIDEATDAAELLVCANLIRPDLVVLDGELPGASTLILVHHLRQYCPSIKIIMLSEKPEFADAARVVGADAFVCKMDSPDYFLSAINKFCDRSDSG